MSRYSMTEKREIAAGGFFTEAELRAKPWLRRLQQAPDPDRRDPNNRPVSAEALRMVPVCAYCYEPGDERSALAPTGRGDDMHPECDEAWVAEQGTLSALRARYAAAGWTAESGTPLDREAEVLAAQERWS